MVNFTHKVRRTLRYGQGTEVYTFGLMATRKKEIFDIVTTEGEILATWDSKKKLYFWDWGDDGYHVHKIGTHKQGEQEPF